MIEIQMTKKKQKESYNEAFVLNFEHLDFGFVSDFEIRISCFKAFDVALGGTYLLRSSFVSVLIGSG